MTFIIFFSWGRRPHRHRRPSSRVKNIYIYLLVLQSFWTRPPCFSETLTFYFMLSAQHPVCPKKNTPTRLVRIIYIYLNLVIIYIVFRKLNFPTPSFNPSLSLSLLLTHSRDLLFSSPLSNRSRSHNLLSIPIHLSIYLSISLPFCCLFTLHVSTIDRSQPSTPVNKWNNNIYLFKHTYIHILVYAQIK